MVRHGRTAGCYEFVTLFNLPFYSVESNRIGQFVGKKETIVLILVLHNRSKNTLRIRAHTRTIRIHWADTRVVDTVAVHVMYVFFNLGHGFDTSSQTRNVKLIIPCWQHCGTESLFHSFHYRRTVALCSDHFPVGARYISDLFKDN